MRIFYNFVRISSCFCLILCFSCAVSQGTVFKVTVAPSSYDFGQSRIGTDCNSSLFTVTNKGRVAVDITSIELSGTNPGSYSVVASIPMNINPGSSKSFTVKFIPSDLGLKEAMFSIHHSEIGSPIRISLKGSGIGTNSPLTIFEDDFSDRKGWTMTHGQNHTGTASWFYFASSNITGGSWTYLSADSNHNPWDEFDEYVDSPKIDCSHFTSGTITLEFDGNYQDNDYYRGYWWWSDYGRLLVYDGSKWIEIDKYDSDWSPTGQHVTYYISAQALGNSELQICFHYYRVYDYWSWHNWNYVYEDHYFKVDNVKLTHTPE
ncbi:MAG: choice-of-anchor D domain-containing protein [Planctomycetes bacterium]|nr:choice-of-anchor D domain-containing protein [Planctomycetota bacterium]